VECSFYGMGSSVPKHWRKQSINPNQTSGPALSFIHPQPDSWWKGCRSLGFLMPVPWLMHGNTTSNILHLTIGETPHSMSVGTVGVKWHILWYVCNTEHWMNVSIKLTAMLTSKPSDSFKLRCSCRMSASRFSTSCFTLSNRFCVSACDIAAIF